MHTTEQTSAVSFASSRSTSLAKVGGALGIAASFISLAIFLLALVGLNAAFIFSPIPLLFSLVGIVVTVCGGVVKPGPASEETQPIAALFVCLIGLVGGLLELMFWSWTWT